MSKHTILSALSSRRMASLIRDAKNRIIYIAPGVQTEVANAIFSRKNENQHLSITVSLDFDERTMRMGYGSLEAIDILRNAKVRLVHYPGLRLGVFIVDNQGWFFTPTALYLEREPKSDEAPNAVRLMDDHVSLLSVCFSSEERESALNNAASEEEAALLKDLRVELCGNQIDTHVFENVKKSLELVPPVQFDIARQVRVFEPYLQYVDIKLVGAAIQKCKVRIPQKLLKIGENTDLEGKLRTTFDLIEKDSKLSSKKLEDELNEIRNDITPSLGAKYGRVVLKSSKPILIKRVEEFKLKLDNHQRMVEQELQKKLDESKMQVVEYYIPLIMKDPPVSLKAGVLNINIDESICRVWIERELNKVFPVAKEIIRKMNLEEQYKDVTYETLNQPDFLNSVKKAFPQIDWDKTYNEFVAAKEGD